MSTIFERLKNFNFAESAARPDGVSLEETPVRKQADLFDLSGAFSSKPSLQKNDFLGRYQVTLRLDQFLVGLIILMVGFVFVFSFGVENGKQYALDEMKAQRIKYDRTVEELRPKSLLEHLLPHEPKAEIQPVTGVPEGKAPVLQEKALSAKPDAGKYTVQIVTYQNEEAAHKFIEKLTNKGHKPFLIPSGKYLQVCLDSFDSRQSASKFLQQMKSEQVAPSDAFVRVIPR